MTGMQVLQAKQQLLRVVANERLREGPKPVEHWCDATPRHVLQEDVHQALLHVHVCSNVAYYVAVLEVLVQVDLILYDLDKRLLI